MDGSQDISKIIGIIMENPDIIEKIRSLAEKDDTGAEAKDAKVSAEIVEKEKETSEEVNAEASAYDRSAMKKRRHDLLSALKPYVKSERRRAIDTMLSVIEVIDVMKVR